MPVYIYALLGEAPGSPPGDGIGGECVRICRSGGLFAAVGDLPSAPVANAERLRAHDAVVRRLTTMADAVLPARFGSILPDDEALSRLVAGRAAELAGALRLVAGREQMTLRVYGEPVAGGAGDEPAAATSGAAYLGERLRAERRARAAPEIDWLRPSLATLIAAERVERHHTPPLLASVHHLIPRGRASAYLAALARATGRERPVHVVPSGPWPPYAFAPEAA
jgi:gas vesicle protein GvpL/GvpF